MPGSTPFGDQLRRWRRLRGVSQLSLALDAGVSARHVSFLETGRSRPSERVVLQLADSLDAPVRERNDLLAAAGLRPVYHERALDDAAMTPYRELIAFMLERHLPYPAYVIDRWWQIVDANAAAERLMPVASGTSVLALMQGPWRPLIANFAEVAWALVHRLRRECAEAGHDAQLEEMLIEARALTAGLPEPAAGDAPAIPIRLAIGGRILSTISTIARFGSAREITLDELRVELLYPADDETRQFFEQLGAAPR